MKKLLITIIVLVCICTFIACETNDPNKVNPQPDSTQVDLFDNDSLCLSKNPIIGPNFYYKGLEPFAQSYDYSLCLIATSTEDSTRICFNTITKKMTVLDKKIWDNKRNDWIQFVTNDMYLSCPYDNKKFFGALYAGNPNASVEKVKEYAFWGIFEPESGAIEEIEVKIGSEPFPAFPKNLRILRWLSNSTVGNDYFFLSNNTILHLQSGVVTDGVTSVQYEPSMIIESVSPNSKLLVYNKNNKSFINGIELTPLPFGMSRKVFWSNDSKYISSTSSGITMNSKSLVEIHFVDDIGNANLVHTINLTKRFCSFGFAENAMFLSNNSIGTCVFKYDEVAGNFYEISFDGKLIKEWTNFWFPK